MGLLDDPVFHQTDEGDREDCAQLLRDVATYLQRFVAYPSEATMVAHTLWIAHAHFIDAFDTTPRILFRSPEPGSGKTRALELTERLVPRPVLSVNATSAYVFRKVSDPEGLPTILYDEIDTVFGAKAGDHEDLRGLINAGYRRGAVAGRCVVRGKTVETEEFPAFCAVAMAGLHDLPDTIQTRSIVIRMRKRAPSQKVEPWRARVNGGDAELLLRRLVDWAVAAREAAQEYWPELPPRIQDRAADLWEPLVTVADLAGGEWPALAREAAVTLVTASEESRDTEGGTLLRDIRAVFDTMPNVTFLSTEVLISELRNLEDSEWRQTLRDGTPKLDGRRLARLLKSYDIKPVQSRYGEALKRGYHFEDFGDAWERYLGDVSSPPNDGVSLLSGDRVTSVTSETQVSPVESGELSVNAVPTRDPVSASAICDCGAKLTQPASLVSGRCIECSMSEPCGSASKGLRLADHHRVPR